MSDYTEHYRRVAEVYETLGELNGWYCPGNHDFTGWYRSRQASGDWDGEGRAFALAKEYVPLRSRLDRMLYSTINYAPPDWYMNAWDRYRWGENKRKWEAGESPTPGYGDILAYAPFADIDLADDVKQDRPDGDIPQIMVESALDRYIQGFADLAGDRRHVYALDSVGGAYVMIAPTATSPIAELLDKPDRAVFFEDLVGRLNDWLQDLTDDVNAKIPAARETFEPDLLNNKNRLYKAPLSLHSSLEGVVTPFDPHSPTYEYTPLEAVDDALISETVAWADGFTSDHRGAVGPLVAGLYPDYCEDPGEWRDAVLDRVDEIREERQANRKRRQLELSAEEVPDVEETDDLDVIKAKIEAIDVQDLAASISREWDTAPGRNPPRFAPPWRDSDSGTSCFATQDKWVDLAEGRNGGGPLKLIARSRGIITHSSQTLRGDDYWRAVNELRKAGYDIPYFTGANGTHPDYLQLIDEPDDEDGQRRQALRAMRASQRSG